MHKLFTLFGTTMMPTQAKTSTNTVETIVCLLIGTKQTRLGSLPSEGTKAVIKRIVEEAINFNVPIPVIVPWGGRKSVAGEPIDVSEVSAIKQLITLDTEVRKLYPLGLQINIRVEDTGALWLFQKDNNDLDVCRYSTSFQTLVRIMAGEEHNLQAIKESSFMDTDEYFCHSTFSSAIIQSYLLATTGVEAINEVEALSAYKQMKQIGWIGTIPAEQRDYYYNRYRAAKHDITHEEEVKMLADYLGGAKARYDLNGRCEPQTPCAKSVQITFMPPVEGAPESMFSSTLYWRTTPLDCGRTHIAPWRGKGYLQMCPNGETKVKIASWHDHTLLNSLTKRTEEYTEEGTGMTIKVSTDFHVTGLN